MILDYFLGGVDSYRKERWKRVCYCCVESEESTGCC